MQKDFLNMDIGTNDTNPNGVLSFSTAGVQRMFIDNTGNVGIGGAAGSKLEVYGDCRITDGVFIMGSTAGFPTWQLVPSVNLGFYRNGAYIARVDKDGNWIQISDLKLKKNINPYHSVIDGVKKLDVVTYQFKNVADECKVSLGLIAQNVSGYFPEIVSVDHDKNGEETLGLMYAQTGVIALKAIQEQQTQIEKQQILIEELKREIQDLKKNMHGSQDASLR